MMYVNLAPRGSGAHSIQMACAVNPTRFVFGVTLLACAFLFAAPTTAQQAANPAYQPKLEHPTFAEGEGPVVAIDESHHNFHTLGGRYAPFARLLQADGYQVTPHTGSFADGIDRDVKVLVIANALHESNTRVWRKPTPSAFTAAEIDALEHWIKAGGSLFLIADHMPFPGAAADLAGRLDIEMANGFAFETNASGEPIRAPMIFQRDSDALGDHAILTGRDDDEQIDQVASFTGQAFRATGEDKSFVGLLKLPEGSVSLEPDQAWQFNESTTRRPVGGWYQGACLNVGEGRVVVFGEAAMFTSQRLGNTGRTNGLTADIAEDNEQLLLNIMHWLTGQMD